MVGVAPAKVAVGGAGMVGTQALRIAVGMGAEVTVLDVNGQRLRYLDDVFGGRVKSVMSNHYNVMEAVSQADLVIRVTTHDDPTYLVDGGVHYAVANMPGAVPRTSTFALTNATLPYVLRIAAGGLQAVQSDKALLSGVNVAGGEVTYRGVADAFGLTTADAAQILRDKLAV